MKEETTEQSSSLTLDSCVTEWPSYVNFVSKSELSGHYIKEVFELIKSDLIENIGGNAEFYYSLDADSIYGVCSIREQLIDLLNVDPTEPPLAEVPELQSIGEAINYLSSFTDDIVVDITPERKLLTTGGIVVKISDKDAEEIDEIYNFIGKHNDIFRV